MERFYTAGKWVFYCVIGTVHRTVKRTAKRTNRGVDEAVFWLNSIRGKKGAGPYELEFGARPRMPGVSTE